MRVYLLYEIDETDDYKYVVSVYATMAKAMEILEEYYLDKEQGSTLDWDIVEEDVIY